MSKNDELVQLTPRSAKYKAGVVFIGSVLIVLGVVFLVIVMIFELRYSTPFIDGFDVNEFDLVLEGYEEKDIGKIGTFGYKDEGFSRTIYKVNKDLDVEGYGEITVVDNSELGLSMSNNEEKIMKINRLLDDGRKVRVRGSDLKVTKLGDRYILGLDRAKYLEYEEF